MLKLNSCLIFLSLCLQAAAPSYAEDFMPQKQYGISGDWSGNREFLDSNGINFDITNTIDLFANTHGGTKRGSAGLNLTSVTATVDGQKLYNVRGSTVMISAIHNLGQPDRHLVNAIQGIDNLEAEKNGMDVYQAWVQQDWYGGGLSFLTGIYDFSNEFYDLDSSDFFINNAFGIGPELANTAKDGPAIFPTSAPSIRLRVQPSRSFYVQSVYTTAVNGDPQNNSNPGLRINGNSNAILMGETAYLDLNGEKQAGKIALGVWKYNGHIDNLLQATTPTDQVNQGAYFIAEHYLHYFNQQKDKGLKGFFRFGSADTEVNRFDYGLSFGLLASGVTPGRENSQVGMAFSVAHTDKDYLRQLAARGFHADESEKVIELSYQDKMMDTYLSVQPTLQYVFNPGGLGTAKDAIVGGLRIEAKF